MHYSRAELIMLCIQNMAIAKSVKQLHILSPMFGWLASHHVGIQILWNGWETIILTVCKSEKYN